MKTQNESCDQDCKIITIDSDQQHLLRLKTEDIRADELAQAQKIYEKLYRALSPYFPAAGLAAPQIGILRSLFLFSYDRDPKNLEAVINPGFFPVGESMVAGWEGCLSVILTVWKLAKVPRYEKIQASYTNLKGERIERVLEGFAAKVFQHEYDHLEGIVNIERSDAVVKEFATKEELQAFTQAVKKEDAAHYKRPS